MTIFKFVFPLLLLLGFQSTLAADKLPFQITVLTKPVALPDPRPWQHSAVCRSLKCGLEKIGVQCNFNPKNVQSIYENVLVLNNFSAVLQAVGLKRQGKIKKLFIGPCFSIQEFCKINKLPEIDCGITGSDWAVQAYVNNEPQIKDRLKVWPSGVDTSYWQREDVPKENSVLIYQKGDTEVLCNQVETHLKKQGWSTVRISYGSYTPSQYKQALQKCSFAVFLSRSESQGLALAEAWSMDVPTLCWDPKTTLYEGRVYASSSCPYLTCALGKSWYDISEFEGLCKSIKEELPSFFPRKWVLLNMSDEVSATLLKKLFEDAERK